MNTIKFSKISNLTTEQHNLELIDIHEDKIFGESLKIYHPCNLNIFIGNICHNRCGFCINKNVNPRIDDKTYYAALKKCLSELQGKHFEITITGGEPTLEKERLVEVMRLCKEYGFPCRTFSTTGRHIMTPYEGKLLCQHMIENNFINNINISRMDISEEGNKQIFIGDNLSNEEIEKLAVFFNLNDAQMRISCNLIEGHIDTFDRMLGFVDFYRKKEVETVMFRELVGVKNSIKLADIACFDERFSFIERLHGLIYDVDIYRYKDMLVKHYITKENIPTDVVFSMSFNEGILMDNFCGNVFKKDMRSL